MVWSCRSAARRSCSRCTVSSFSARSSDRANLIDAPVQGLQRREIAAQRVEGLERSPGNGPCARAAISGSAASTRPANRRRPGRSGRAVRARRRRPAGAGESLPQGGGLGLPGVVGLGELGVAREQIAALPVSWSTKVLVSWLAACWAGSTRTRRSWSATATRRRPMVVTIAVGTINATGTPTSAPTPGSQAEGPGRPTWMGLFGRSRRLRVRGLTTFGDPSRPRMSVTLASRQTHAEPFRRAPTVGPHPGLTRIRELRCDAPGLRW